jgi:hypothetical protein
MKIPYKIAKNSSLDYNSYIQRNPDEIVFQSNWTAFTEPLLVDADYHKFRTTDDAFKDFKTDLETFDNFGEFNYHKLDSYKLEQIITGHSENEDMFDF